MNVYCAPDLPFWDTVTWYTKQILAGVIIMSGMIGIVILIGLGIFLADRLLINKRRRLK